MFCSNILYGKCNKNKSFYYKFEWHKKILGLQRESLAIALFPEVNVASQLTNPGKVCMR